MSVKRRDKDDKESNWYYRFTYKGQDFCEGGFRTSGQAMEAERLKKNVAIQQKLHPEEFANEITWTQGIEWWLTQWAPKKRSRFVDHGRLPLIRDFFGDKGMRATKPEEIADFLSKVSDLRAAKDKERGQKPKTMSDHTRNHYLALIRALYERLKKMRKYSGENPALCIDKVDVPVARCRFIYPAEEKILTPAIAADSDLFLYYRVGIETGMRIGEMRGVLVKHVDLTMGHIFIPHPKNNRSRYVPIDESLMGLVGSLAAGKGLDDHLLPHWGYSYLKDHLYAICEKLELKGVTIHVWRHTFAYNRLSQGEPLYKVSKLMGHSSQAVTEKHYGHLAISDLRDPEGRIKPFLSCNRFATGDQILA